MAFGSLKTAMVRSPILTMPTDDIYVLDTDASNHSIGAVLSQIKFKDKKLLAVVCFHEAFQTVFVGTELLGMNGCRTYMVVKDAGDDEAAGPVARALTRVLLQNSTLSGSGTWKRGRTIATTVQPSGVLLTG